MFSLDTCVKFSAEVGYFAYLGHANQLVVWTGGVERSINPGRNF